ncbi:MAG: hypothetical protein IPI72_14345 [Flavobacteriales bacterium]|nr:hypothetical protein [Flavobacteriales bacterium]
MHLAQITLAHLPAGRQGRIQEESLYYETLKHSGEYPIIGVNTFLSSKGSPTVLPKEVILPTLKLRQAGA